MVTSHLLADTLDALDPVPHGRFRLDVADLASSAYSVGVSRVQSLRPQE